MQARISDIVHSTSRKAKIPKALREQVWITHMGHIFQGKCKIVWCQNRMSVFDFQCGHNIPESKGGKTNISNLIPICSRCNLSMSDQYTIDEWNSRFAPPKNWKRYFKCQVRHS